MFFKCVLKSIKTIFTLIRCLFHYITNLYVVSSTLLSSESFWLTFISVTSFFLCILFQLEHLAFYLIELCLVEYEALNYKPSMLCASAIYLARCTMKMTPTWTPLLEKHTRYEEPQLRFTFFGQNLLQKHLYFMILITINQNLQELHGDDNEVPQSC